MTLEIFPRYKKACLLTSSSHCHSPDLFFSFSNIIDQTKLIDSSEEVFTVLLDFKIWITTKVIGKKANPQLITNEQNCIKDIRSLFI